MSCWALQEALFCIVLYCSVFQEEGRSKKYVFSNIFMNNFIIKSFHFKTELGMNEVTFLERIKTR